MSTGNVLTASVTLFTMAHFEIMILFVTIDIVYIVILLQGLILTNLGLNYAPIRGLYITTIGKAQYLQSIPWSIVIFCSFIP